MRRRPGCPRRRSAISARIAGSLALAVTALAGCDRSSDDAARSAAPDPTVIVTEARTLEIRDQIGALGTTLAREAVEITARGTSVVASIHFTEGQEVGIDQILVRLDGVEAEAELALARAAVRETRSRFSRSEALAASGTFSEFELDELAARLEANEAAARAAQARLDATVIRAPFAGQVGLRRVSVGSLITPGTVMTTLDDLGRILVDFVISETDLAAVRIGMEIEARSATYADGAFAGRVVAIDTRVAPMTRSVTVRAELPNDDRRLRPGMFLEVSLLGEPRPAVMIPEQAIVPIGEQHFVFRVVDGHAWQAEVELGLRRPGSVEIVAGLADGELVIVEGTQKVADAAAVKPVHTTDYAGLRR